jgi:hypothetical protein
MKILCKGTHSDASDTDKVYIFKGFYIHVPKSVLTSFTMASVAEAFANF